MKNKTKNLLILTNILFFLIVNLSKAQNFVRIGSEEAPIRYIEGTESSIGIIVGVELQNQTEHLPKTAKSSGEITVGRLFRDGIIQGPGQGMGKIAMTTPRLRPLLRSQKRAINRLANGMSACKSNARLLQDDYQDYENFQIYPVYDYDLEAGVINELYLPVLCMDQRLDVLPAEPEDNFTCIPFSENIANTFIGIYRFDEYVNEEIVPNIWYADESFIWYEGTLSDAEILMASFCEFELDSTSLNKEPAGYYDVTFAYLFPVFAQWPLWAASHDQNEQTFLDGYNYILEEYYAEPPVTINEIIDFVYLNHTIFHLAEMTEFKSRFREPDGMTNIDIYDLYPFAYIQTNPDLFEVQNNNDGIQFNATHSMDVDGNITKYAWSFDGGTAIDKTSIHIKYNNNSSAKTPVILTVTDNAGSTDTDTVYVPYSNGVISAVGQIEKEKIQAMDFRLSQNYPNPFNASTCISFQLNKQEFVTIKIMNILGQEIKHLTASMYRSGMHKLIWDGKDNSYQDVPSGLYFCHSKTESSTGVKKLLLIR